MINQLLNWIERYLVAECPLQDLKTWLLSNLQDILDSGDRAAIELANEIDADLVELHEGLIDEMALRERLEGYIRRRGTVFISPPIESPVTVDTSAYDKTIIERWQEPKPVEEYRLNLEFA